MSNKERLFKAFNNEEVDRVPVGFWFHFLAEEELGQGLKRPELIEKNIASHKKYIDEVNPDLVKIMSDGYFHYPSKGLKEIKNAGDLNLLESIGENHKWIEGQVNIVKGVTSHLKDTASFYNIFGPATLLRFTIGHDKFMKLLAEDKEAVKTALDVVAKDLSILVKRVIKEGQADGVYLSVQNPDSNILSNEEYKEIIAPSELLVLASANEASENNVLHCCGYAGHKNDLTLWKDYDAKAINWAVTIEGVSLSEGKKLFKDKAVIGGFDSRENSLIHKGSREDIEEYTKKIIQENGTRGIIIGGDCTIPGDIDTERIKWIRSVVEK